MRSPERAGRYAGERAAGVWLRAFPGQVASVPVARAWARELLAVRIAARVLDDVLLLLSEVVTNAVAHSESGRTADGRVTVLVSWASRVVHVEVTDSGSAGIVPVARVAEPDNDRGRGLWLVNVIATAWGSHHDGETTRTVWFDVAG